MSEHQDTIFALSSGHGRAGIAVIRISGPAAPDIYRQVTGHSKIPEPNHAHKVPVYNPHKDEKLDDAMAINFAAPRSFTGENSLELHVHGGRAVISSVLAVLGAIDGLRPAEPGEFTRRAFENGKIDLTAAEGINDLIHAETARQQQLALRQAAGEAAVIIDGWRQRLVTAMAMIAADLDFSDEEDVPSSVTDRLLSDIGALRESIREALATAPAAEIVRDGFHVAIVGAPNAGKSSLLNAIARRDAAIVSDEAGTTRDVVQVDLDLAGIPVTLYDTAGLRETDSAIEREGIRRTHQTLERAHLVLWITDATAPLPPQPNLPDQSATIHVRNKIDIAEQGARHSGEAHAVSALTGEGVDGLVRLIAATAEHRLATEEPPIITRERHRHLLTQAEAHLDDFLSGDLADLELRAEDLRLTASKLAAITGRIDVEDMLDVIFSEFCIGK